MRALLVVGLLLAGCSSPPEVAVVPAGRADLVDSFREEAETRFRELYVVSMPSAGRIGRIDLEPGDSVRQGQILTSFDRLPSETEVSERAAEVQQLQQEMELAGDASVESAEIARSQTLVAEARRRVQQARAAVAEARARAAQQERELQRSERLQQQGALPRRDLEQAQLARRSALLQVRQAEAQLASQQAMVQAAEEQVAVARHQRERREQGQDVAAARLEQARARLLRSQHEASQTTIKAPITGVVVERFQVGPGPMPAGEKLLSLAQPQDLEAESQVLTQDALRLKAGTPVQLHPGPDRPAFPGVVSRVEPRGFTKLSSLGVEQKRVRVEIRIPHVPKGLGANYRLDAEFMLGQHPGVLSVPRSTLLQKPDGTYFVLVVRAGKLHVQPVKLGVTEDLRVEILSGLAEGDVVVRSPESTMAEGQAVKPVASD